MPLFFGRNEKKQELIANLDKLFEKLHKDRDIPQGDFPEVERMREQFQNVDFADLPKMNNEHITALNDILRHDLTELYKYHGCFFLKLYFSWSNSSVEKYRGSSIIGTSIAVILAI